MQNRARQRSVLAEPRVADFVMSMPKRYREQVDWSAAREHARIVWERGRQPAHAGLFDAGDEAGPGLCVVAPDAPGLLAAISASLMLEDFDVQQAEAYTRKVPDGGHEAVDLFWVRRQRSGAQAPLTEEDVTAVRSTLIELLSSGGTLRRRIPALPATTAGSAETSVRFVEHPSRTWLSLELETVDRTGILLAVTSTLFAEGVQIIGSQITTRSQRAHDLFYITEADGSRIAGSRLQRIQLAVLAAVEGLRAGSAQAAPASPTSS
jgi:[protein-PII] uridylyltransferase